MPKADLTDITIVLDRSGSMASVATDTIGGFNRFLDDQKAHPGQANLTLVQFDNEYEFVCQAAPIRDVSPLTDKTFVPRGSTALLDAMGRAINETGARLSAMSEPDRPSKVVFVILTDGHENASREFSRDKVFGMVKHQQEAYRWDFIFLAANQDAIAGAASLAIPTANAMNYASTPAGTSAVYGTASATVGRIRSGQGAGFTDQERADNAKHLVGSN